jgi:hypothetical protein
VTEFVSVGADFRSFVRGFAHSAFRLEVRDRYNEPAEADQVRRFVAGEEPDDSWLEPWCEMVRARVADGRSIGRVRVISEPHSDYTRYLLRLARLNVAAGEDIRYLPRAKADGLDLPGHDFWLIDSTTVGVLRFGNDDILLGLEIITDPAEVVRYNYWRDVARHYATPWQGYRTG